MRKPAFNAPIADAVQFVVAVGLLALLAATVR